MKRGTLRRAERQARRSGTAVQQEPPPPATVKAAGPPILKRHARFILGLWLLASIAYSNSFFAPLVFDNKVMLTQDPRITAATSVNIDQIFTQDYWYNKSSGLFRPFTSLSYLFNYTMLGDGTHPAGYHLINFGLHAVNATLVYLLGLLVLGQMAPAFAIAAVWAVHPVATESVTNVVGRADLLSAFGILAGLLCHVHGAAASGWRKLCWLAALLAATTIGAFSKETGVMVVLVMLIYDLTWRDTAAWGARIAGYLTVAPPLLIYWYYRVHALTKTMHIPFTDNPLVRADFFSGRLTAIKVIGKYMCQLVWPGGLSADYSYNQIPVFHWRLNTWEDWQAPLALAACMAAAGIAILCYRRQKPVFFFIAFFFATLAPSSNIAVIIGSIRADRFLYLPSIGFAGCVVVAVYAASRRLPATLNWAQKAAPATLAVIAVALAARTFARNLDWNDDVLLWTSAVRVSPNSYKAHNTMALAISDADPQAERTDEAIREAERGVAIVDSLPDTENMPTAFRVAGAFYRRKGDVLRIKKGDPQGARYLYEKARDRLLRARQIDRAYNQWNRQEAIQHGNSPIDTGWDDVYMELGMIDMRLADPRDALDAFEYGRNLKMTPEFFSAVAEAQEAMGDLRGATTSLIEGLVVDINQKTFASKLVELYRQISPTGCAVETRGASSSLNMNCPLVHDDICKATQTVFHLYLNVDLGPDAVRTRGIAVRELGCSAELFQ